MLENLQPPPRNAPCRVADVLESLNESDRDILNKALIDPSFTRRGLSVALRARGITIATETLRKHIENLCNCKGK